MADTAYEFEFDGGEQNIYSFSTIDRIRYNVKFVPSDYLFDAYPDLDAQVFEMIISIATNSTIGNRIPSDAMVGPTIALIFSNFFQNEKQAIVFICDSSDGRQEARSRKFSTWFQNQQTSHELVKIDRQINDGAQIIYLSLVLFNRNPQKMAIISVFLALGEEEKQE